jgi:hypothetical protein
MSPKEKAKDLYDFYNNVETPSEMNGKGKINLVPLSYLASKKCSSRTVDEIILLLKSQKVYYDGVSIRYWQEVKQEIEKL